jgi:hypothetical protein
LESIESAAQLQDTKDDADERGDARVFVSTSEPYAIKIAGFLSSGAATRLADPAS